MLGGEEPPLVVDVIRLQELLACEPHGFACYWPGASAASPVACC